MVTRRTLKITDARTMTCANGPAWTPRRTAQRTAGPVKISAIHDSVPASWRNLMWKIRLG
jgi:hypothetical protein